VRGFLRDTTIAKIPSVLSVFDLSAPTCLALAILTWGRTSECCFRLNGIFYRELSRSLVDQWLLVRTPIAFDPPNPTSNYLTAGLTAGPESDLTVNVQMENRSFDCR
jgi:hypothetical protein